MTEQDREATIHTLGNPSLPPFEGVPVALMRVKISGLSTVEGDDLPVFSVDDRVRLVGQFKCIGVRHYVDPKTGDLVREQVLTPTEVTTTPFDPADPNDDGVIRARP